MIANNKRSCLFVLALVGLVSGAIAQDGPLACGYRLKGQTIDLSSLTVSKGSDYFVSDNNPSVNYTYEFNVCAASTTTVSSCSSESAAICQTLNGAFTATIAKFPSDSQFALIDSTDLSKGLVLQFANGDLCNVNQKPRTSRFYFLCANQSQYFEVEDTSNPCDYAITIYTPLACVASTSSFSPPPFYVTDVNFASSDFTHAPLAHLADVNNDGFVDLVYSTYRQDTPSQSINSVYLNNGKGWVSGSSKEWQSPIMIDRAISAIQDHYRAGQLTDREYSALILLSAHPKYRGSVEVLFRNFNSDAYRAEFMKHALNLAGAAKADLEGAL